MDLNSSQLELLVTLIELYRELGRPVRSSELAERVGRSEGTVRSAVAALKALGLVDSKTGPLGGYTPTAKSLELVERGLWGLREPLPLEVEGRATRVRVVDVELIDVPSPVGARAILRVAGKRWLSRLEGGARIRLGPTPYTRLVLAGRVVSVDRVRGEVVVDVDVLTAIPRVRAGEIMSSSLVTASAGDRVEEVARRLLRHNIRAVPVVDGNGLLVGLASTARIMEALLEGRGGEAVGGFVDADVATAAPGSDILEIMGVMDERGVGRVVVVDEAGRPVGMVTRTDILRRLVAVYSGKKGGV